MILKKTLFNKKTCLNNHDPLFLCCSRKEYLEVQETIDQMYNEVYEYITDPHFENLIQTDFHGAYWQLYITWAFHKYGLSKLTIPKSEGPDIILEDGTIIEAVNATPGEGENRPDSLWGNKKSMEGGVVLDPDPKIVLRITNAISSKKEQHRKWVEDGIVFSDQPFVIAVNAGIVSPDVLPHLNEPSYGAKTVYAIGSLFLIMPRDPKTLLPDPDKIFTRLQYSPEKIKHNGKMVETDLFLTKNHKEISGLLFSPSHYLIILPNNRMKDLEYLSNGMAKNSLPKGILNGIQNTWIEIEEECSRFQYFHEDRRWDKPEEK